MRLRSNCIWSKQVLFYAPWQIDSLRFWVFFRALNSPWIFPLNGFNEREMKHFYDLLSHQDAAVTVSISFLFFFFSSLSFSCTNSFFIYVYLFYFIYTDLLSLNDRKLNQKFLHGVVGTRSKDATHTHTQKINDRLRPWYCWCVCYLTRTM